MQWAGTAAARRVSPRGAGLKGKVIGLESGAALPSTYCKHILRLKFIVNRGGCGGFESARPLARVNKPNGLWKFATFARCLCLLPTLFLAKNLPLAPPRPPLSLGRFRFYLSKVFHSAVIVWVASSIVAKANIYLGVRFAFHSARLRGSPSASRGICTDPTSSLLAALCYKLNLRGLKSNVVVRNDSSPTSDTIKKLIVR